MICLFAWQITTTILVFHQTIQIKTSYLDMLSIKRYIISLSMVILFVQGYGQNNIKIGVYDNPPKIFINDNGQPDGFFIDLISELSNRLNFTPEYINVTWPGGLDMLEAGEIDIMPDMLMKDERKGQYYLNHITILENWASIYIHKGDKPEYYTLQDLKGKSIAVLNDDNNYLTLKTQLAKQNINVRFAEYKDYASVLQAVSSKRASMGLVSYYFGKFNASDYEVQELQIVVNPATIHLAAMPGKHNDLLDNVDKQLVKMKENKDSIYYELIDKWLNTDKIYRFPRWLSILLILLSGILLIFIVLLASLVAKLRQNARNLDEANNVLTDEIHQKNKVEGSLRKNNEQLASINHSLDHLVYQLSHNLRGPIASVIGLTNLLKHDMPPASNTSYIDKMEESMSRLDTIIRDILDYYKNSRSEIVQQEIDWEAIVKDIYSSVEYLQSDKPIDLQVHIDQKASFTCDGQKVKSILHNLISNAIKYHDPRKDDRFINVEGTINENWANLTVSDNGMGIPGELHDKVFNMFFRGTDKSQGAGLGLYIVKETMKRLKGKLEVESKVGKGSRFHLKIPNMCESSAIEGQT